MPLRTSPIYSAAISGGFRQGEILSGVVQFRLSRDHFSIHQGSDGEAVRVEIITHPLSVIVTQDCDLDQEYRKRQNRAFVDEAIPPNVLLCEVFEASSIRHPESATLARPIWDQIKANNHARYQFLEAVPNSEDRSGEGLPELCIDFKKYFTIPINEMYAKKESIGRRCVLCSPYREHLTTRFAYYLCRIPLPEEHQSLPAAQG